MVITSGTLSPLW